MTTTDELPAWLRELLLAQGEPPAVAAEATALGVADHELIRLLSEGRIDARSPMHAVALRLLVHNERARALWLSLSEAERALESAELDAMQLSIAEHAAVFVPDKSEAVADGGVGGRRLGWQRPLAFAMAAGLAAIAVVPGLLREDTPRMIEPRALDPDTRAMPIPSMPPQSSGPIRGPRTSLPPPASAGAVETLLRSAFLASAAPAPGAADAVALAETACAAALEAQRCAAARVAAAWLGTWSMVARNQCSRATEPPITTELGQIVQSLRSLPGVDVWLPPPPAVGGGADDVCRFVDAVGSAMTARR